MSCDGSSSAVCSRSGTPPVSAHHLRQEFSRGRGLAPSVALDDVSSDVYPGTPHALVGESGPGRTTTGASVAEFDKLTSRSILIDGAEVAQGAS